MDSTEADANKYIGSLIKEGFYDKLIIIGYPYDVGATRCGVKKGQDYGAGKYFTFVIMI